MSGQITLADGFDFAELGVCLPVWVCLLGGLGGFTSVWFFD